MARIVSVLALLALAGCGGGTGETAAPVPLTPLEQVTPLATQVRAMADETELPAPGSPLEAQAASAGHTHANCVDFSLTLLALIKAQLPQVQAREIAGALTPDQHGYDSHTLVEVYSQGDWRLIDPLFALIPHNADGSPATAQDMQASTRAQDWTAINYEFISPQGDAWVRHNYLDWPLYFVNVYSQGAWTTAPYAHVLADFYAPDVPGESIGAYAVQCAAGQESVAVSRDGVATSVACDADYSVTYVFAAVELVAEGPILTPQRHVFEWDGTCNVTSVCEAP